MNMMIRCVNSYRMANSNNSTLIDLYEMFHVHWQNLTNLYATSSVSWIKENLDVLERQIHFNYEFIRFCTNEINHLNDEQQQMANAIRRAN